MNQNVESYLLNLEKKQYPKFEVKLRGLQCSILR